MNVRIPFSGTSPFNKEYECRDTLQRYPSATLPPDGGRGRFPPVLPGPPLLAVRAAGPLIGMAARLPAVYPRPALLPRAPLYFYHVPQLFNKKYECRDALQRYPPF